MRNLLKLITWPLRIILFLLLAILASLNLHEGTVYLFLGHQWRAPMAVLLLVAFAAGALLGVLAVTLKRLRPTTKHEPGQSKPIEPPVLPNAPANMPPQV